MAETLSETPTVPGGNALDRVSKLLTSTVGSLGGVAAAIALAATQFKTLSELPKTIWKKSPDWLGGVIVVVILLSLAVAAIWDWVQKRRIRRYVQVCGTLKRGYFTLQPREQEEDFDRADNAHIETLKWIQDSHRAVLYLTGASGTGKSSVLAAWVVPKLKAAGHVLICLRGYEDLLRMIGEEILQPGVIWDRGTRGSGDLRALLSRAHKNIAPRRIFFVIDQFDEFLILKTEEEQEALRSFLNTLNSDPIEGVTFLFAFRAEYGGMIDSKGWPERLLRINLRAIFSFDESAAQEFLNKSQKTLDPALLQTVFHEAYEIEAGAAGLIRPITLNLCGLVLGRFANGLPGQFRGSLIRGFLRESISLPETSLTASKIIPRLITRDVTKRPRTIDELVQETGLKPAPIKACLYRLGSEDRGIVRALDAETQKTWEISHDFLVPLLDAVVARWSLSLWRRCRPWLPWIATGAFALAIPIVLARVPLQQINDLGWNVNRKGDQWSLIAGDNAPQLEKVVPLLRQIGVTKLQLSGGSVNDVSSFRNLPNLTQLDLKGTTVRDVSPLRDLPNLTQLHLGGLVTDVSPLKDLPNLAELYIDSAFVLDVSSLKGLPKLTLLDLTGTRLSNVSYLRDFHHLTHLTLVFTGVSDFSFLRDLPSLTQLNLSYTKVNDISFLKGLHNLTLLDLGGAPVRDFSYLKDLHNLVQLNLNATPVSDVSLLGGLQGLTNLSLASTKVSDISPLKDLHKLVQLNLNGAQMSDVSPLKDLHSLIELSFGGSKVSDISAVQDLHNLTVLELYNTQVSDVSPLKGLTNLTSLDLHGTQVSDVSSLKDLHNLTRLDLRGTRVSNVSGPPQPENSSLTLLSVRQLVTNPVHGSALPD